MNHKKLNSVLTDNTGLFLSLNESLGGTLGDPTYYYDAFDWTKDTINYLREATNYGVDDLSILDDDYFTNESGEKIISPLLKKKLDNNGKIPTTNAWTFVWQIAMIKYKLKWDKDWEALKKQYNPIENYSMTEEEELPKKTTETKHYESYDVTRSEATNKSYHTEENADVKDESSVYGFNSNSAVPVGESNQTKNKLNNYSDSTETGDAEDNVITESHSKDGDDNKETTTEEWNKKRTLTRKGNIGVTTSQQMIESTLKLYMFNFIHDVVYRDLDEILTLEIYESEI